MQPSLFRFLVAITAGACALATERRPAAAPALAAEYEVRVIAEPAGRVFPSPSRIEDLNDRGALVLWSQLQGQRQAAYLWKDGKIQDLGNLGGKFSWPHALNNQGQVVGESRLPDGVTHAFLWESGKLRDLGSEPGLHSAAWDLNDRGEIVGHVQDPKSQITHAARWVEGKLERLRDFGWASSATFVNNRGVAAGYGQGTRGAYWHGFFWKAGEVKDLAVFPGWETGHLADLNDLGEAVGTVSRGESVHSPGEYLPVRTTGTDLREIPELKTKDIRPEAINDAGWILGAAPTRNVNEKSAFLLREGRVIAVDDLIRGSGWTITGVADLNNAGQIAAYGKRGSEQRGLLLSPRQKAP